MYNESRPRETACFYKHHPHHTETGHSYMVTKWQDNGEGGAVPWEARCKEAYERKMAKYTEL